MDTGLIGGGVLGLTAALRLARRGHRVTVLEREPVIGGLAGSFEVAPGTWLEKFYHHIFRTDRAAIALIEELGLGARLRWHRPVTTVWLEDRAWPLDSPRSVLAFGPLGIADRLRLAAGVGLLRVLPTHRPLEGTPAGRWMRRTMGERAYGTVWSPLLRGKFGDAADEVSMAWLWARIHCRTAELGYLDGGFHQLYVALAAAVEAAGGTIRTGVAASGLRARPGGAIDVTLEGGEALAFERVVSTLPTPLTARLADLPESWRARHPAPAALGAHCLVLALDRPLTGTYWIGVNEPGFPFLAVVEHTAMVPPEAYGGRHLVYLGNYRRHDDPLFAMSTEAVLASFEAGLRRLNPAFERAWVREAWSFGAPFAQPVVTPGFARSIPGFDMPLPGLHLATMFQVYPYDRGQNYSIELAERLVRHLEASPAAVRRPAGAVPAADR